MGEVGPVDPLGAGSIIGELELPNPLPRLALLVVAFRTKLPYPSASSVAISLQSELLVPRSKISLTLLILPSLECLLGVRTGALSPPFRLRLRLRLSVVFLAESKTGGTIVAPAEVGIVCMTKNFSVALASPIVEQRCNSVSGATAFKSGCSSTSVLNSDRFAYSSSRKRNYHQFLFSVLNEDLS